MKPYVFLATDKNSLTYGMWRVRVDAGTSYDGMSESEDNQLLNNLGVHHV